MITFLKKFGNPLGGSFVLLLAGACGVPEETAEGGMPGDQEGAPVEVSEVSQETLLDTVRLVGSLAYADSILVRPESSGLIREIHFSDGSEVEEGDLLVRLDDRELRAQLEETKARLHLATVTLERTKRLFEERTVPRSELDVAEANYAQLQAEVSLLEVRIDQTKVRAAFSGITGTRRVSRGDYVTPETIITRLDDGSQLEVVFQVPERFLPQIGIGTPFQLPQIGVTGLDIETAEGEVRFIDSTLERRTRASQVKGVLTNPPEGLKPGMFVTVELVLHEEPEALVVPEAAIGQEGPMKFVFAVRPDEDDDEVFRVHQVPVETGLRFRGSVQVLPEGELSAGDKVISAGVGILRISDGDQVSPRDPRELANSEL
ncbi:MAG: efflux RND transporter periplasmic adaptor subunit [Opitutales bacterium]|nr:efflux RND transporter periplasmic adaptor subunit [Opitutales bacterium]